MPLTPCHAAAAWPIRRALPALPLVLTATAAGALGNAIRAPGHGLSPALGYAALGAMAAFAAAILVAAGVRSPPRPSPPG